MQALEKVGAVKQSGDSYLANWTVRRMVRIPLKAVPHERLQLSYLARPAFTEATPDDLLTPEREAAYCFSPKRMNAKLRIKADHGPMSIKEYAIATGIDGRTAPRILLTKSATTGATPASLVTFACGPYGSPIAVAGNISRRPVAADPGGNVRILEVTRP